jgi:hypothetical protein
MIELWARLEEAGDGLGVNLSGLVEVSGCRRCHFEDGKYAVGMSICMYN